MEGPRTPDTFGEQPRLAGTICNELIVQSFLLNGELVSLVNAVYIKANDSWHRLVLDAGTIHWGVESNAPLPWAVPENGWSYPHANLGATSGLAGLRILSCVSRATDVGCTVDFEFEGGRWLYLAESSDEVRYAVT